MTNAWHDDNLNQTQVKKIIFNNNKNNPDLSSDICELWEEEWPVEGELEHVVPPDTIL